MIRRSDGERYRGSLSLSAIPSTFESLRGSYISFATPCGGNSVYIYYLPMYVFCSHISTCARVLVSCLRSGITRDESRRARVFRTFLLIVSSHPSSSSINDRFRCLFCGKRVLPRRNASSEKIHTFKRFYGRFILQPFKICLFYSCSEKGEASQKKQSSIFCFG